jgi:hypothetical protein
VKAWIEDVEDQPPSYLQRAVHAREAAQLVVDRHLVLQGPEGREHEPKAFAQIELTHVALMQAHALPNFLRLASEILATAIEHRPRAIEAGHVASGARDRQQDASRATSELQRSPVRRASSVDPECHVAARLIWTDVVVQLSEGRQVVRLASRIGP